jgi:hypothetical protein
MVGLSGGSPILNQQIFLRLHLDNRRHIFLRFRVGLLPDNRVTGGIHHLAAILKAFSKSF